MSNNEAKAFITAVMWLSYLAMIWFTIPVLEIWTILLAFVMGIPLMGGMSFMWVGSNENKASEVDSEKRKRERLDSVLRDLSNEDLLRLKQRLTNGTVDDELLHERLLGDDGELLNERR